MLKMLIVEDERWEREGLKNFLDWSSLGIAEPEVACDGIEGVEKACYIRPDIIITDIKMPGMNGLKMSSKIQEFLPNVKIVILTGYDDFELAREAIGISANAYILKPVEEDEMLTVLEKVVKECRDDRKKQEEKRLLEELIDGNTAVTRRELLLAMLKDGIKQEALQHILDLDFIPYYGNYTVIAADVYLRDGSGQPEKGMMIDLDGPDAALKPELLNCGMDFIAAVCDADGTTLFITGRKNMAQDISKSAKAVVGCLSGKGFEAMAGVGTTVDCIAGLHLSCRQAKEALNYGLFWGDQRVTAYSALENIQRNSASKVADFLTKGSYYTKQMMRALRAADSESMTNLLEQLYRFIDINRWADVNMIKNFFYSLLNETHLLFYNTNFPDPEAAISGDLFLIPDDIASIREYVSCFFEKLLDIIRDRRTNKVEYVIKKVQQIITEKYNLDINIKTIAAEIYLSPNYLGNVFKNSTGKSLVEYLCQYRMEKARELLQSPKIKVSQVAKDVGVPNTTYFCTLFKDRYGVTPGEYQEMSSHGRK